MKNSADVGFLVWSMVKRDFLIRYRQTKLGILLAIAPAAGTTLVFTFLLGKVAKLDSGTVPYAAYVVTGVISWQFLTRVATESVGIFRANAYLIQKTTTPKYIFLIVSAINALIDFFFSVLLAILLVYLSGGKCSWNLLILPFFFIFLLVEGFSFTFLLSVFGLRYRWLGSILPLFLQIMMYSTPAVYPSSSLPTSIKHLAEWNPLSAIPELSRLVILGSHINFKPILVLSVISPFTLLIGYALFVREGKVVADYV